MYNGLLPTTPGLEKNTTLVMYVLPQKGKKLGIVGIAITQTSILVLGNTMPQVSK